MRLAADRVHSFDYDPNSVACARELKRRFFPNAQNWEIERGDVLDASYLRGLGQFDVVYSWGVLHHTGNMWQALQNVAENVSPGGNLFIALYNDQDVFSGWWTRVKERYNRNQFWRWGIIAIFGSGFVVRGFIKDVVILRKNPFARYRQVRHSRGMAYVTDLLDWLGGYPFEVAKPEAVFDFFREKGLQLSKLKTAGGGPGNNQFVFVKCVADERALLAHSSSSR
jgi:SAM-dependent methyltransferase